MSATKIQVGKTKATPNDTLKHTTGREDGEDLLMLELLGGKDLLVMDKNDKSDPFVITRVLDKSEEEKISSKLLNGDSCGFMKKNCYRSSICFQTLFPQWNESYSLWIPQKAQENLVVRFDVFDWDRIGRDYMGKVIIPVQDLIKYTSPTTLCLDIDVEGVKQRKKIRENGGQLEVQAVLVPGKNLERHYLVAEKHIGGLQELFFRRPFSVQVVSRVAYSETSDEMASAVCELAAAADSLRDVVRELVTINVEATNQESTLFRTNSMATKAVRMTLTLQGEEYLQHTLGPLVMEIIEDSSGYELNTSKMPEGDKDNAIMHFKLRPDVSNEELEEKVLEMNREKIHRMSMAFVNAIEKSVEKLPMVLREMLADIRAVVGERFPDCSLLAVGGFFFLRFLVPAIATPEHFSVIPNHTKKITAPQRRALTLISKIIQNMANGTVFGSKEGFMTQANPTIEAGTPIVTAFLQVISTEENGEAEANLQRCSKSFRSLRQWQPHEAQSFKKQVHSQEEIDSMAHLITRFDDPKCLEMLRSVFKNDLPEAWKLVETIQKRLQTALDHAQEDTEELIQAMTSRGGEQPTLQKSRNRVGATKSSLAYDARVVPEALSKMQQGRGLGVIWRASDKSGGDYAELKGGKFEAVIPDIKAGEYLIKFRVVPVMSSGIRHVIFDVKLNSNVSTTIFQFSRKMFTKDDEQEEVVCVNAHDAPGMLYFSAQASIGLVHMKIKAQVIQLNQDIQKEGSRSSLLGQHKAEDGAPVNVAPVRYTAMQLDKSVIGGRGDYPAKPVRKATAERVEREGSGISGTSPARSKTPDGAPTISVTMSSSSGGGERNVMPLFVALINAGIPEERAKQYVQRIDDKDMTVNEFITNAEVMKTAKILIGDKAKVRKYVRMSDL